MSRGAHRCAMGAYDLVGVNLKRRLYVYTRRVRQQERSAELRRARVIRATWHPHSAAEDDAAVASDRVTLLLVTRAVGRYLRIPRAPTAQGVRPRLQDGLSRTEGSGRVRIDCERRRTCTVDECTSHSWLLVARESPRSSECAPTPFRLMIRLACLRKMQWTKDVVESLVLEAFADIVEEVHWG